MSLTAKQTVDFPGEILEQMQPLMVSANVSFPFTWRS